MLIRPCCNRDLFQIKVLLAELGYEIDDDKLKLQLQTYINSSSSTLLVNEADDSILGFIAGHLIPLVHDVGNLGRITALTVTEQARRQGVGSQLVSELESWFVINNCKRFEVTSGDHRHDAHSFYESCGFERDERRFIKRQVT